VLTLGFEDPIRSHSQSLQKGPSGKTLKFIYWTEFVYESFIFIIR